MSQILAVTLLSLLVFVSCISGRSLNGYEKEQVFDILQNPEGREVVSNELGEIMKMRILNILQKMATDNSEVMVDDQTEDIAQQLFADEPVMVRKSSPSSTCILDFWKGRGKNCRQGRSAPRL
ncbi:uncharacterized protein LOC117107182 [Anneissia japonica]|uniref:uncharacterized protein LOC117107182 n=1 Tax=Anneissia japonica TaxID=1529436 RepID=UPI001425588B|nr:uncharacterized protein LOC117107182 [Anneissia japonica]